MGEGGGSVEVLRRRFDNGEPAQMLRHAARDVLLGPDSPAPGPGWVDDSLIVISELIQNVSQHTRSSGELVLTLEPGAVLIEVGDTDPSVPHARQPDPAQIGGRGLLLIGSIARQWGVRICPGGKSVWARLETSPDLTAALTEP